MSSIRQPDEVPFSLLDHAWLPVQRADGSRGLIKPAEITSQYDTNPVVRFSWARADFDAASREFLIGLLATACHSLTGRRWQEWFRRPPVPAELDAAFARLHEAFLLDGQGPRFMQDREDFGGDEVPVSQLLIEAPGANTLKKNLDHFVRRGRVETLSRRGAAMALFTLQDFAPTGGAGHRTSLRGGGPLSTLVIPGPAEDGKPVSLWQTLWLNTVASGFEADEDDDPLPLDRIFPWLGPTRVSEKGQTATPDDTHPLHAYWGMPRRIRLIFEPNSNQRCCDLTGDVDSVIVRGYRTRPYGMNYSAFIHPLSPYYRAKGSAEWLPLHGQPGRIGYRHWVGLIESREGEGRRTAEATAAARKRLGYEAPHVRERARLVAAGYDMDNMKARDFIESEMPLHQLDEETARHFSPIIDSIVRAADEVQRLLVRQVKDALLPRDAKIDAGANAIARDRFWEETEGSFHSLADELANGLKGAGGDEARRADVQDRTKVDWLRIMRSRALRIFDDLVPTADLATLRLTDMQKIIAARKWLGLALAGYGKAGLAIYEKLGLNPPTTATPRKKKEIA